ncbi:hypothetical protein SAMN04515674_1103 [Pseudarcicella hirudinis]|uniref:DUF6249 domain-containing protein n=1 Tax=Pseudarcicella hirudinis TaxID=1079859 RepID=A0A1I5VQM7_9BACT|nr:DUF6249 domain-containing protein [Pseudarcicella hirudinis]SFQ09723.1 hypothetical protein SAMN04515674_1103 [Pseudarcicella hirudinis]
MISTEQLALLIPITSVVGFFTMIIFIRKYQNDESMAMISKGIAPSKNSRTVSPAMSLRLGLLAIGAGLGLLIGGVLANFTGMDEETAYFSMILIFGGAGLLLSYIIQLKMDEKDSNKKGQDI